MDAARGMDVALEDLFNFSHVGWRGEGHLSWTWVLVLVMYSPVGALLLLARVLLFVVLKAALLVVPRQVHMPPGVFRALCVAFGVIVRARGLDRSVFLRHKVVVASNHVTAVDAVAFVALFRLNVLIDHGYFELVQKTYQKIVGAIPFDKRWGREAVRSLISRRLGESHSPLLLFPEGWDTSGRVGLLRFAKFTFGLGLPVLPVALRARVPLLPMIQPSLLGSTLLKELLWCFFCPFVLYDLEFLGLHRKEEEEAVEAFAGRVQRSIANALGVKATEFTNYDALAFRADLMNDPELFGRVVNRRLKQKHEQL